MIPVPITCAALDAYPSTPPFGVVPHMRKLDCSRMEPDTPLLQLAGVMVWGTIARDTWSPLVLIHGTMTAQWYVHDILKLHLLPLMQRLPGAIFNNTILGLTRLSPHCCYPSLACPIPRFVPNRANLGSFETASWTFH
ncbi:transposable element Tcb1 transposase [Trichonephila clavipes]|nr:transposable element Tcb1 transposase [Trichonephila clavipes]